jgi:predicted glycosyltransferase
MTTHAAPPEERDLDAVAHPAARSRPCRVALYSPGMVGLGHMRRNQLIARALANSSLDLTILMIAEARQAGAFAMPPGVDCLTLPAIREETVGQCRPRYLGISLEELIALRANAIRAALEAFDPDVLIVDNRPRGAVRELEPALEGLRQRGGSRCVLGLRDILDDPVAVEHEWRRSGCDDAIHDYYDVVWVYGDPAIYDPVREYHFSSDVAAKVRYVGYLDQRMRLQSADPDGPACSAASRSDPLATLALPPGRLVLCSVGGGQDGARLAEAFAQAELPPDTNGVILTGPFMPEEVQQRLHFLAARHPRLRVLQFISEPVHLLQHADRVIAMGGYNTVCELLSFEKSALVVPRVTPRQEQWIRARRLRSLGLLDLLHPDELSPQAISDWLARGKAAPLNLRSRIDLNGLERLPHLLREVLPDPLCRLQSPFSQEELIDVC